MLIIIYSKLLIIYSLIYQKIVMYLIFLNVSQLERQGADLQTKIEELQIINKSLRENDKVKEDVIANLSDKLSIISERLDKIEKTNNNKNNY